MWRNFMDNPFLLIVLVLIIVLVFGANKLPGAARSLGRSLRIFKSEVRQMGDDDPKHRGTGGDDEALEGKIVNEGRQEGDHTRRTT